MGKFIMFYYFLCAKTFYVFMSLNVEDLTPWGRQIIPIENKNLLLNGNKIAQVSN